MSAKTLLAAIGVTLTVTAAVMMVDRMEKPWGHTTRDGWQERLCLDLAGVRQPANK